MPWQAKDSLQRHNGRLEMDAVVVPQQHPAQGRKGSANGVLDFNIRHGDGASEG